MESAVSTDSAYVQEHHPYRVPLVRRRRGALRGLSPTPKIPNVLVYPLGDAEPGRNSATAGAENTTTSATRWSPSDGLLRLPPQSRAVRKAPEGGCTRRKNLRAQTPRHELSISPFPLAGPRGRPGSRPGTSP